MLVLFLRPFKYIFPHISSLNSECANECVQRSFSARDFPSAVDGWLSTPHRLCHRQSCPPFHASVRHLAFRSTTRPPFRIALLSAAHSVQVHSHQIFLEIKASLESSCIERPPIDVFACGGEVGTTFGGIYSQSILSECLHFH